MTVDTTNTSGVVVARGVTVSIGRSHGDTPISKTRCTATLSRNAYQHGTG